MRPDHLLFGEAPGRFVISYRTADAAQVAALAAEHGAPLTRLGATQPARLQLTIGAARLALPLAELSRAWRTGFARVI